MTAGQIAQLREQAFTASRALPATAPVTGARWQERGPSPIVYEGGFMDFTGWQKTSGRVISFAVDPRDASGSTVYAGTSAGGLWHSTNAGTTWRALFQDQPSLTVGAIALDPTSGVLHVGTGESNPNLSGEPGHGILRSTDDGRSWHRASGIPLGAQVWRVVLADPARIFAATTEGLFVSTDAGLTYSNVLLPTDEAGTAPYAGRYGNVVSDVVVHPDDPERVTAVVGYFLGGRTDPATGHPMSVGNGLYRSTEGGLPGTWSRFDAPTFGAATTSSDPIGRTSLAYASGPGQDHDVLWALIQDATGSSFKTVLGAELGSSASTLNGVYRSADDGASWQLEADSSILSTAEGSVYGDPLLFAAGYGVGAQSWFDQYIAVDPTDESRVLVGLEEGFTTASDPALPGPSAWRAVSRYWAACRHTLAPYCQPGTEAAGGEPTPHPDHHAVAMARTPTGVRIYDGGDGGIYVADLIDGERLENETWQPRNDGIGTAKPYYAVMGRDGQILAGHQDNGTTLVAPGSRRGTVVTGGDGGAVAIDPRNADVMYAESQGGSFYMTSNGWESYRYQPPPDGGFAFITPFSLDDAIADHLLIAGNQVYESDAGPSTETESWVSVFDIAGVSVATDLHDGAAYVVWCSSCSPPFTAAASLKSGLATNVKAGCSRGPLSAECWHHAAGVGLPNARLIRDVYLDRRDPSVVVVGVAGYFTRHLRPTDGASASGRGQVFFSRDAGESFTDISAGLPDTPANSVLLRGDEVYVGTDVGVFVSARPGAPFRLLGADLPPTPVFDLSLNPQRDTLVAATHGRGVWTLDLGTSEAAPPLPRPRPPGQLSRAPLPATGAPVGATWLGVVLLTAAAAVGGRGVVAGACAPR